MQGVVILIASLLLSGAAVTLGLRLQKGRTVTEFVVLSLAFGALTVPVSTFAIGRILGTLPASVPYLTILFFAAVLAALVVVRRPEAPKLVVTRHEVFAMALTLGNLAVISYFFTKYPIFPPEFYVHDYVAHLLAVTQPATLLYGWLTNSLFGITQITSYLYMGYGVQVIGGAQIVGLRYSMLILGAFFPLLIYYASRSILGDGAAPLFSTAGYCFVSSFWVSGLLTVGLYGEFYVGILEVLFVWMTAELATAMRQRTTGEWGAFLLVGISLVFAHVTSLMLMLAVFLFAILVGVQKKTKDRRFWGAIGAVLLTGLVGLLANEASFLGLIRYLAAVPASLGISQGPPLSQGLSVGSILALSPFLLTLYTSTGALALVFVLLSLGSFVAALALRRSRDVRHLLPVVWFLVPMAAATFFGAGPLASPRYSFYALVPMAFIFGLGYVYLINPTFNWLSSRAPGTTHTTLKGVFAIVLVLFIVASSLQGGVGPTLGDAAFEHNFIYSKETGVFASMLWIQGNTQPQSAVFSVGLPWYQFSSYVDGRQYVADNLGGPREMSALISSWVSQGGNGSAPVYVAMFALLRNSTGVLSASYLADPQFVLTFNNSMVLIFRYQPASS